MKINFDYDEKSDVLYISFGQPHKCATEELTSYLGLRWYSKEDKKVMNGITIIDFAKRSDQNISSSARLSADEVRSTEKRNESEIEE